MLLLKVEFGFVLPFGPCASSILVDELDARPLQPAGLRSTLKRPDVGTFLPSGTTKPSPLCPLPNKSIGWNGPPVTMYLLRQARCAGADWHAPDDWKRKLLRLSTDRPTSPACFYWWHGPTRAGSRFRRMQTTTDRLGSSPFRSMKSGWQDHLLFCPPQICFRSSTKSASKLGMAQTTTPDRAKSRD